MSLATLGSKLWSPIHHQEEIARYGPRTAAERMAAGRALTRHAVLGTLALGCVAYGLAIALTIV